MRKALIVGKEAVAVEAEAEASLLSLLREPLLRKSVVRGCANGECGACRVMVNGAIFAACKVALRDVPDGATILTREDVDHEPDVTAVVRAFEAERPTRCRLCVGGLAVTAHHLTRPEALPSPPMAEAIDDALTHATCMCTGRGSLRRALHTALVRKP